MKKAKPKKPRSPRIENSIIKQWTTPKKLALITDWDGQRRSVLSERVLIFKRS